MAATCGFKSPERLPSAGGFGDASGESLTDLLFAAPFLKTLKFAKNVDHTKSNAFPQAMHRASAMQQGIAAYFREAA